MARTFVFALLSIIVFFSSISSGLVYFKSIEAEKKLRSASIIKAKVGAVVKQANLRTDKEKNAREKAEKTLFTTANDLGNALSDNKKLNKALRIANRQLTEERQKVQKYKSDIANTRVKYEEALKSKDETVGTFSKKIKSFEEKLARMASLKQELQEEQKKRQDIEGQYKSISEEMVSLKKTIAEKKINKEKVVVAKKEDNQENLKLKQEIDLLKQQKNTETENRQKVESRLETINAEKKAISEDLKLAQDKLSKFSELEKKLVAAEVSRKSSSEDLLKSQKELALLKKKVADLSATSKKKPAALSDATLKLKNELDTLKKQRLAEQKSKKALETDLVKVRKELKSLKKKLKIARTPRIKRKTEKQNQVSLNNNVTKKKENRREKLAKNVQKELKRLGCYNGQIDGVWGERSLAALNEFSRNAETGHLPRYPSSRTVELLKSKVGKFCPKVSAVN